MITQQSQFKLQPLHTPPTPPSAMQHPPTSKFHPRINPPLDFLLSQQCNIPPPRTSSLSSMQLSCIFVRPFTKTTTTSNCSSATKPLRSLIPYPLSLNPSPTSCIPSNRAKKLEEVTSPSNLSTHNSAAGVSGRRTCCPPFPSLLLRRTTSPCKVDRSNMQHSCLDPFVNAHSSFVD